MNHLMASQPVEWKLVTRNPDGSGVIEMPVLSASSIDRSLTAGGGEGRLEIGVEQFEQFIANFQKYPGPVPVGTGDHVGYGERSGPQPGFVEGLSHDGQRLWARIWLDASLMAEVQSGHYRGFSIEFSARGIKLPTADLEGHVLVGGLFTNRPAAPVHFKPPADLVAAGMALEEFEVVSLSIRPEKAQPQMEASMADTNKGLESLQAETDSLKADLEVRDKNISALNSQIADGKQAIEALETKAAEALAAKAKLQAEYNTLKAEATGKDGVIAELQGKARKSEKEIETLRAQIKEREDAELAEKTIALCERGVAAGMKPATFDGHESDPVAWLRSHYGTAEVLENVVQAFESNESPAQKPALSSGHDPAKASKEADSAVSLSDTEKETLERLGLPVEFATVKDAAEAQKIAAELKKQQAEQK